MTNSFHQIPLGPISRQRLSVVTPWGQFQPRFLPEGVAPASIIAVIRGDEGEAQLAGRI